MAPAADNDRTAQTFQEFETEVLLYIRQWARRNDLTPDSLINGKPIRADGDDAWELLEHVADKTGTKFEIDFPQYFGSEAQLYGLWQRITGRWPRRTKPLSIRTLARLIYEQRN